MVDNEGVACASATMYARILHLTDRSTFFGKIGRSLKAKLSNADTRYRMHFHPLPSLDSVVMGDCKVEEERWV